MTITPLFTAAELDQDIAAFKAALRALASAKSVTVTTGGGSRSFTREDLPEIRRTLDYLQQQRASLQLPSGPQALVGRVSRGY